VPEKNVRNLVVGRIVKSNLQRHYTREIERTVALLNTHSLSGRFIDTDRNFISARHDDNFNKFERHWIAPLEEVA
jgi:hypothetical protein